MPKKQSIFLLLIVWLFSLLPLPSQGQEKLIPEHKQWLELVDPIITKVEREVFLQLSNQEKNKFIKMFWGRRDPMPDTEVNEFYQEYMERVRFADRYFGFDSPKKGSLTERGRFYLILGPPLDRQIYATHSDLNPLEMWHYKGESKYGLPPFFYLIFYQPRGLGEYRLYSPGVEGPERLVSPTSSSQALNRSTAYKLIRDISGELAGASLSYIPGEAGLGTTTLSSAPLIANIGNLVEKKYSDTYARNFLYYKDFVETEYSHNYIDSHYQLKIFENFGQLYLHWTIEPSQMNFAPYQDKSYAAYQVVISLEDQSGKRLMEKTEEIPLSISPEDYEKHKNGVFAFQDILPVIPGSYKLYFLLQNKTGKEFTSFNSHLYIPAPDQAPRLSNLLLYQERTPLGPAQKNWLKAFVFDGSQYEINAQNNCLPKKDIGLFCQVSNLGNRENLTCRWEIYPAAASAPVLSMTKPLTEVISSNSKSLDIHPISLAQFSPGYYRAEVSILEPGEKVLLKEKENFILLAQPHPIIPWTYARRHNPPPNPNHIFLTASQYFMTGNYDKSEQILREAVKIKPDPRLQLLLAQSLFAKKSYKEALDMADPVYAATRNRDAAKIIAASHAELQDWQTAVIYLEELLKEATELPVLNLAAECYFHLNLPQKALPLIEKSLRINPNQVKIKELEKKIKNQEHKS